MNRYPARPLRRSRRAHLPQLLTALVASLCVTDAQAYMVEYKAQVHQYLAGESFKLIKNDTPDRQAMRNEFAPYIGQRIQWNLAGLNSEIEDDVEMWSSDGTQSWDQDNVQLWQGSVWTYSGDGEGLSGGWPMPYCKGEWAVNVHMLDDNTTAWVAQRTSNDIIEGAFDEDYYKPVEDLLYSEAFGSDVWEFWDHHFAYALDATDGSFSDDFGGGEGSAFNAAETYWRGTAVPDYDYWVQTHDASMKGYAYGSLGHVVHLLQDISGPDHAQLDGHMPDGGEDEFEIPGLSLGRCGFEDYTALHYAEYQGSTSLTPADYHIAGSDPIMQRAKAEWDDKYGGHPEWYNAKAPLFWLFYSQVEYANEYPSNDECGEDSNKNATFADFADDWRPDNNSAGKTEVDDLIPMSMRHVAGLYQLFWDTTHPVKSLTVNNNTSWYANGVPVSPSPAPNVFPVNIANAQNGMSFNLSLRPGLQYDYVRIKARSTDFRDQSLATDMYWDELMQRMFDPDYVDPNWHILFEFDSGAEGYIDTFDLPQDGDWDLYVEVGYREDPYGLEDGNGHHAHAYKVHQYLGLLSVDRQAPNPPSYVSGDSPTSSPFPTMNIGLASSVEKGDYYEWYLATDTGNMNVPGTTVAEGTYDAYDLFLPLYVDLKEPLEDGKYILRARTVDAAGNASVWKHSSMIHVDTMAPSVTLHSPSGPPYKYWGADPYLVFSATVHDYPTGTGVKKFAIWNETFPYGYVSAVTDLSIQEEYEIDPEFKDWLYLDPREMRIGNDRGVYYHMVDWDIIGNCSAREGEDVCPIEYQFPDPVPSWEEANALKENQTIALIDGPNLVHVFASDKIGNERDDIITVYYSDPAQNEKPTTKGIAMSSSYGAAPLRVQFDPQLDDPDMDDLTVVWNFGDGTTGTGMFPYHIYTAVGPMTVTMTATDVHGATVSASAQVWPELPEMIYPSGSQHATDAYLTWSQVSWVSYYEVLLQDLTNNTGYSTQMATSSWLCPTLVAGHQYTIQVRAKVENVVGPWSTAKTFTAVQPMVYVPPTPLSPNGNVGGGAMPTFAWGAVAGCDQYELQVLDPANGDAVVLSSPPTGNTQWTANAALQLGKSYKWKVRGRMGGVFKGWSSTMSFVLFN